VTHQQSLKLGFWNHRTECQY